MMWIKKVYRKCSGRMSAEWLRSHRKNWHEGLINGKSNALWSVSQTTITLKVSSHIIFHVEPLDDTGNGKPPGRGSGPGKASFLLIVLMLSAKVATWRRKALLKSKAGYPLWIQLSLGFHSIWPKGTSVLLTELSPKSHLKTLFRDEGMIGIGHAHHPEEEEHEMVFRTELSCCYT